MTIRIETKSGGFDVEPKAAETVLFAGLREGFTLPYECATGTCGTCRARVMEGHVVNAWATAPGGAKLKPEKGDVLMCQSRADGPCTLRVPSEVRIEHDNRPDYFEGEICEIERMTHDVIHFEIALARPIPFIAGQFVVVSAPGVNGGRAYSMVNYTPTLARWAFAVKRKPDGGFSEWLFTRAEKGSALKLFGPLGKATFNPHERQNLVVVAGGSGIAGMMSILACAERHDHFRSHRGQVFFGVRTLADGFYLPELAEHVTAANGALEVTLVLSHEDPANSHHPDYPGIKLDKGFVHEAAMRALSAGVDNPLAFVAGPPPMVDGALRMLLRDAKVPAGSIKYDKFG